MKIRAIVPDDRSNASVWWRIERPLTMLRNLGHDTSWHLHDEPFLDNVDFENAIVIIHRIIPNEPAYYIQALRSKGASALIYSMDDNVIDQEALSQYLIECGGLTTLGIQRILDRIPLQLDTMLMCNYTLVSTQDLAEIVSAHTEDQTPILVLENAIDENWFSDYLNILPPYRNNGKLVHIGWASGRRPDSDLIDMARAWQRIDKMYDNVRFVVAGWQPDILDSHINLDKKIRIPYKPINEWPPSMQVDIGCCTVSDTLFNRGKSPIKYYEYSLAGAAVVATPFYEDVLVHGLNGCIAANEDEWVRCLIDLIEHPSVRSRMVDSAIYNIHNYTSLEATISKWQWTLENMI